ncbi:MAG: preprotein translocase subunit YajC [Actinomycetota bacterium]|nr:preprotein translocase subunit YajC [Actinomycetota bacterium]
MSNWVDYLPLVLLVLVFWFLILRPMRKRQQQFVATQKSIVAGSRVMLASGLFGDVISVDEETVELKISPETTVTVLRQAIARVIEPEQPEGN